MMQCASEDLFGIQKGNIEGLGWVGWDGGGGGEIQ